MRVSRQWRNLKYRKWHGFRHNTDQSPRDGDMALECPTCPKAGINIPIHGTQVQNHESLSDQRVNVTNELPNLLMASTCVVDGYT